MSRDFMYLVAIVDWYSRYVLSWRLANSLESGFCVEALDEALASRQPDIFNTDQGDRCQII
jgi:putative transposase